MEAQEDGKAYKWKNLIRLLYLNFLGPIIIVIVFAHELSGSIIIEKLGINKEIWEIIKLLIVIGLSAAKTRIFREELQFQFD